MSYGTILCLPMRALIWCHVNGENPPHVITRDIAAAADLLLATGPSTLEVPLFRSMSPERVGLVLAGADFARLEGMQPKPHSTFNVGYIGTVDFVKMHPDFLEMSAAVEIPQARFIVCGEGGALEPLRRQAREAGNETRFEFRGYVEDVRQVLADLDVFGYPLCEENYSTSDLVLQEVMYAGIPPVVLPFGGTPHLVIHGESGLVARDKAHYVRSIHYLYSHPDERVRLGRNAASRARQCYGARERRRRVQRHLCPASESGQAQARHCSCLPFSR